MPAVVSILSGLFYVAIALFSVTAFVLRISWWVLTKIRHAIMGTNSRDNSVDGRRHHRQHGSRRARSYSPSDEDRRCNELEASIFRFATNVFFFIGRLAMSVVASTVFGVVLGLNPNHRRLRDDNDDNERPTPYVEEIFDDDEHVNAATSSSRTGWRHPSGQNERYLYPNLAHASSSSSSISDDSSFYQNKTQPSAPPVEDDDDERSISSAGNSDLLNCVVCMQNTRSIVLRPCAHLCLCETCSDQVLTSSAKCPVCRSDVHSVLNVFL